MKKRLFIFSVALLSIIQFNYGSNVINTNEIANAISEKDVKNSFTENFFSNYEANWKNLENFNTEFNQSAFASKQFTAISAPAPEADDCTSALPAVDAINFSESMLEIAMDKTYQPDNNQGCCYKEQPQGHMHPKRLKLEYIGSGNPWIVFRFKNSGGAVHFQGNVSNGQSLIVDGSGMVNKHGQEGLETNTWYSIAGSAVSYHTSCSTNLDVGHTINGHFKVLAIEMPLVSGMGGVSCTEGDFTPCDDLTNAGHTFEWHNLCTQDASQNLNIPLMDWVDASGGQGGTIEYQWQIRWAPNVWYNIPGATNKNYNPPNSPYNASTNPYGWKVGENYWRRKAKRTCSTTWIESEGKYYWISENVQNPGSISGDESECSSYNPGNISNNTSASGGGGSWISYQWQYKTTGNWIAINGATDAGYNPGSISQTTTYRRGAIRTSSGCTVGYKYSNEVIKTVTNNSLSLQCEYKVDNGGWITNNCSITLTQGQKLQLSTNPNYLSSYSWTGPNNFSGSGNNGGDILLSNSVTTAMSGTYTVIATDSNGCTGSKNITVNVVCPNPANNTTATASINENQTKTLTGSPSGGSWSIVSGGGTINGSTYTPANINTNTNVKIRYTIAANGSCAATSDDVTFTVTPVCTTANNTTATASINENQTKTLTGSPSGGSWSIVSGGGTINGSTYTPANINTNTNVKIRYTIAANGSCAATSDDVTFTVTPVCTTANNTTATASINENQTKTLTGSPSGGSWSIVSGGGTINGSTYTPANINTNTTVKIRYRIAANGSCAATSDDVTFTVTPVCSITANNTTATASINENQTKTLTGSPSGGSWSIVSGGGTINGSTYTPANINTNTTVKIRYRIAANGSCAATSDDVTFTVTPVCSITANNTTSTASINENQTKTLTGSPSGGSWSIVSGGGTINGSTYTPANINTNTTVKIRYTIAANGSCAATSDDVTFTVTPVCSITANNTTATASINENQTKTLTGSPSGGSWSIVSGGGTINGSTYTPANINTNTNVKIRYTIAANGSCAATSDDVTFTVTPVCTTANNTTATASINENQTKTLTGSPSGGSWSIVSGGGTINGSTYTPANINTNTNVKIRYTIAANGSCAATSDDVTFTVTTIDDLPLAVDDSETTDEDIPINISVLNNDDFGTDGPNTGAITIPSATSSQGGSIVVNKAGTPNNPTDDTIDYTPPLNYSGSDNFNYTITDGNGDTSTATVTITISPINDLPLATDDSDTVDEDSGVNIIVVLDNDTFGGDGPNVGSISLQSATSTEGASIQVNKGGTPNDPTDDKIDYSTKLNFNGTDTFDYTITDSNGDTSTATVTITVNGVNDLPEAFDDVAITDEDTLVNIDVLDNDTFGGDGPSNGPITIPSTTSAQAGIIAVNNAGTITDPTDDTIDYIPAPNFYGVDTFNYTIIDSNGDTSTATVTVTVSAVNDLPVATNDSKSTNEDTPVNISAVSNDSFGGDGPSSSSITIPSAISANGGTVEVNDSGTPTDPTDDSIDYTPKANFNGTDTFDYTIADSNGDTSTATVTITISPVNDLPTAVDDIATTSENIPVDILVLNNDDFGGDGPNTGTILLPSSNSNEGGNLVVDDRGTPTDPTDDRVNYTPALNFNGDDTFDYTITDSNGDTSTATVTVTVEVNTDPCTIGAIVGTPTANDPDGDGINNSCDLDDDNDGILDTVEDTCTTNNGSQVSFNGSGTYNVAASTDSGLIIDIKGLDNSFNLNINGIDLVPVQLQFDQGSYSSPSNQSLVKFKSDNFSYGQNGIPTVWGINGNTGNPTLRLEVNALGKVSLFGKRSDNGELEEMYIQNNDPQFADFSLNTSGNNTIIISQLNFGPTNINGEYYSYMINCSGTDVDNDGLLNSLDLDSDGDGCKDVTESKGIDANNDGILDGSGYDNKGRVVGGINGYDGLTGNEYIANQVTVLSPPTDAVSNTTASFEIEVSADEATSYSSGSPTYGTPGNANTGLGYSWYLGDPDNGGSLLSDTAIYSGTETTTLSISDVTGLYNNEYYVIVSHENNTCIREIRSATLIVDDPCSYGATVGTPTANDPDGDGINNACDLDDDNDGILDTKEDSCTLTPADLTWHGSAASNMTTANGKDLAVTGGIWSNAYSDQTWSLPLEMTGTITSVSNGMIGFLPVSKTETTGGTWNDGGYKVQIRNNGNGIYTRHGNTNVDWKSPNSLNSTFRFVIDESGNMEYYFNGSLFYSNTVPVEDYKITISRGSFTVDDFQIIYQCDSDIDNDGVDNSLDLDSDGDGCKDVVESGGIDANNDGILDGSGFDADGLVAGGSGGYDGSTGNEYIASQLTVTSGPSDVTGFNGSPASFTAVVSSEEATSYSSGSPTYGTPGNGNDRITYQWYLGDPDSGGSSLSDTAVYSGTETSTLEISEVSGLDGNEYYVVIGQENNSCIREVRSATLTANDPCTYGATLGTPTANDPDGDGINNVCDLDDDNDGILDTEEDFSISSLSPEVWLDASDSSTITESGGKVSQWNDKSGNGHHAVQSNNSYKPSYVQNDLAGKDGVDFYLNKSLRKNTGTQTVGYVIAVLKAENATWNNFHTIFGHRANSRFGGIMQSGNTGFHNNAYPGSVWVDGISKTVSNTGFSTIDSPHIWSYTPNGNTVKTLTNGYNMGSYDNNYGQGSATHYEVVVLPRIPTDEEREKLEGYLAHKWGLASSLPVNHPYKSASPSSDLDGDGLINSLDLDSDGDGCKDVTESGGIDANNDGILDGSTFDTDGLVTGGTGGYDGANGSEYVASQLSITSPPTNAVSNTTASFEIEASADEATSYSSGSPTYGTPGNANTGLTYSWYLGDPDNGGSLLSDTPVYSGTDTTTLSISDVTGLHNNEYYVIVSHENNTCIREIRSATLIVDDPCSYGATVGTPTANDPDGDGINNACDLDDDNDGILDTIEDNLVSSLTAVAGASAITIDSNNFTVNNISGGWGAGSVHSNDLGIAPNEDFTLSLEVELFSQRHIMIGLNASGNNSTNSHDDIDYALYFAGNSVYIFENGSNKGTHSSVTADSDVFSIARVGTTITYSKNGTVFYTSLTASSAADYYIDSSMHDNGNNGYTISNILVTRSSSDLDGDGIPNSLDTDSDGDGCFDVTESGGIDANNDGILDGSGFDADGLVTGGTGGYNGANGSEYVASQLSITSPPTNAVSNTTASFEIEASADEATSYSSGSPTYGTPGNANTGLTYSWYLGDPDNGGSLLSDTPVYSGTDTTTLSISDVTGLHNNEYYVIVSHENNTCIREIRSATLIVDDPCTYGATVGTPTANDPDGDGINNICDLDDDNDGILDTQESNLVKTLSLVVGNGVTIDNNNITVTSALTGDWGSNSVHSNDLGVATGVDFSMSMQADLITTRHIMIGLNASGNNSTASYSDIDYAIYFNNTNNRVEVYENGGHKGNYVSITSPDDVFSIKRTGTTITYSKNGVVFYTSAAASTASDYYIDSSIHDNSNNGYSITNIIVTTETSYDIDNDGVDNSLDLDSDGDGCKDVVESGGIDANNDGIFDGSGYDADGLVTGGSGGYDGVSGNEYIASQLTVTSGPSDVTGFNGSPASFTAVVSSEEATSYSSGSPTYGTPGNGNDRITYQWYLGDPDSGGSSLSDTAVYSGTETSTLEISEVSGLDGNEYYVVIGQENNSCIREVRSATLTANDPCTYGATVGTPTANDPDGDGINNVCDLDDDNDGILDVNECAVYGSLNYEFYDSVPAGSTTDNIPTSGALSVGTVDYWNANTLQNNVDPGDASNMSIRYKGLIDIETTGNYTFYTISDDGSKLFIDGIEVVNNDGSHGAQTRQGNINLTDGYHTIEVLFFQGGGPFSLNVQYQGPGINKQNLPFSILLSSLPTCDTDGDGIINSLDLDSDGDGCKDVVESGGIDANNDGILDGSTFDTDGLVTGGTGGYDGANGSEYVASQLSVILPPFDATIDNGSPASFTITTSSDEATYYNSGSPIYGTPGNGNDRTTYSWYLGDPDNGGSLLTDTLVYSGTDTNTLSISDVTGLDGNEYYIVVNQSNNSCEREIQSATLTAIDPCTYGATVGTPTANDPDGDGINNACDLDDDNDGILDTEEGCEAISYDVTNLTWTGDSQMSVEALDSNTLKGTSTSSWKSVLSDQTFSLPLELSFTFSVTSNYTMIGLAYENSSSNGNWTVPNSYGFYLNSKISYTKDVNSLTNNVNNMNGIEHRIVIDELGNLTLYRNNSIVKTKSGLSTGNYRVYISSNGNSNKPFENISFLTNDGLFTCSQDTDNDGLTDNIDLDSDGDGCKDVVESGGIDANNDGILDGSGFDADGKVIGSSGGYNGVSGNEYAAHQANFTSNLSNQNIDEGQPVTFSVSASAEQATSYNNGAPIYGTPGNANNGINYQWYLGDPDNSGITLTDIGIYTGTNTADLNISNSTGLNGKQYFVKLTHANNSCLIEIKNAILTVCSSADNTTSNASITESETKTLSGNPSGGTWSIVSGGGSITGTTYTPADINTDTTIVIRYTIAVDGDCAATTDDVTFDVTPVCDVVANNTTSIAAITEGQTKTLTGTPAGGTWSIVSGGGSITGTTYTPADINTDTTIVIRYTIAVDGDCAATTDDVTFDVTPVCDVVANNTTSTADITEGQTKTLTGTPAGGTWSIVSGGGFITGTTYTPADINTDTTVTIRYTIAADGDCAATTDDVTFDVTPVCDVVANNTTSTADITEGQTKTLIATPAGGTWSIVSGGGSITGSTYTPDDINTDTTIVIRYTIAADGDCAATTDDVTFDVTPVCDVVANNTTSTAAITEGETKTLTGTPAGGTWSIVSGGGSITGSTYTPDDINTDTTIVIRYTIAADGDCAATTDDVTFDVTPVCDVVANNTTSTADITEGQTKTLTGTPAGGTWSIVSGGGSITGTTYTPADINTDTTIVIRYTIAADGDCAATTSDVTFDVTPVCDVVANNTTSTADITEGQTKTLTGTPAGGTWSIVSGGGFITGTTYTPADINTDTTVTIRYTIAADGDCAATTDDVTFDVTPVCDVVANNTTSTADITEGQTKTLIATPAGGTWSIVSGGGSITGSTYTPDDINTDTTIVIRYTIAADGDCAATTDDVTFDVTPVCDVVANNTTSTAAITEGQTKTLIATPAGGTWSIVSGGGSITGTTYTPADINTDTTVTIRYTIAADGDCAATTDDVTFDVTPVCDVVANNTTSTAAITEGQTKTLIATPAGGTWSIVSGGGSITGTTYTPADINTDTTVTIRYTIAADGDCAATTSDVTFDVTPVCDVVANNTTSTADITEGQTKTLTGTPAGGTWSIVSGGGFITGTTYTPADINTDTTVTIRYTIAADGDCAATTDDVTFDVTPVCDVVANNTTSTADITEGQTKTLIATPAGGTWSIVSGGGSITGSTYTPDDINTDTTIVIRYTIAADGDCAATTDDVTFDVTPVCDVVANNTTSTAAITEGQTKTLIATPAGGTWSIVSGGGSITGTTYTPADINTDTTVTIRYTIAADGDCAATTDDVTFDVTPVCDVVANNTTSTAAITEGQTKTLIATPAGGTWSIVSGGGSITGTTYTPADINTDTTVTIRYTIAVDGDCAATTDDVTFDVTPVCDVVANNTTSTADITEGQTKTLIATPAGGTWSIVSGGGSITGTTYTPADINTDTTVTIRYTIAADGDCAATTSDVTFDVTPVCDVVANNTTSTAAITEGQTKTLTGTPAGGTWSIVSGSGSITGSTYTPDDINTDTTVTIRYTIAADGDCAATTDDVTFDVTPVCDVVANNTTSTAAITEGQTKTLTGTPAGGTWSIVSGGGSITGTTYTPADINTDTTVTIRYTIAADGDCAATTDDVTFDVTPVCDVVANNTTSTAAITEGQTKTLTGTPAGGTWSIVSGGGSITGTTYTPADINTDTTVTIRYTIAADGDCAATTSDVTFDVTPVCDVVANNTTSTAAITEGQTKTLTGSPAGGTWSIVSGGGSITGTTYTPADINTDTTVTIRYTIAADGDCAATTDDVTFDVTPVCDVVANNTTSTADITEGQTKTLTGTPAGGTWSIVSGGGSITGTTYTPADINTDTTVTIRYTIAADGDCAATTSDVTFTVTTGLGSIGDTVWFDTDGDAIKDANEDGLGGATVTLDPGTPGDPSDDTTATTDVNGNYLFNNLPPGHYIISVDVSAVTSGIPVGKTPSDLIQTYDFDSVGTPNNSAINLPLGQNNLDQDFAYGVSSGNTGTGNNGGVESESLGDAISKIYVGRKKNSMPTEFVKSSENLYNKVKLKSIQPYQGKGQTLLDMFPTELVAGNVANVTSPTDILDYTIADEVLSVDFSINGETKGVVLGIKTSDKIYNHTKASCDRLRGAEILNVQKVRLEGYNFLMQGIKQRNGVVEYAISFAVSKNNNDDKYTIQTNWYVNNYIKFNDVYNFQVWSTKPADTQKLVQDILDNLKSYIPVQQTEIQKFPETYASKIYREKGELVVNLRSTEVGNTAEVSMVELYSETANNNKHRYNSLDTEIQQSLRLDIADGYEYNGLVTVEDEVEDAFYHADGNWGLDYDSDYTEILNYFVWNDFDRTYQDDEYSINRNVEIKATSEYDYLTVYKSLLPGTLSADYSEYKYLSFTAKGSGLMELGLIKSSIERWKQQYRVMVDLSKEEQTYYVPFDIFSSTGTTNKITADDLTTLAFTFLPVEANTKDLDLFISNVKFTKTAIEDQIVNKIEKFENNFMAYPNPSKGSVNVMIFSKVDTKATISLFDVTGKEIYVAPVQLINGKNEIDFNVKVKPGVLFLKVNSKKVNYGVSKIIFR